MINHNRKISFILGKCCSLIINGGSSVNIVSLRLVEKLELPIIPHPKPYKLQWLCEKGEIVINKQVNVELTLAKYKDKILCDVVPMEATHIFLRQVTYDGVSNKFSFVHKGEKVILKPLTPHEVIEDQLKMKKKDIKKNKKFKKREN
ncbi:hypothetical protein CR513_17045, partial [Mucuna pruriens]